jgi:hypothetical protein
LRPNCQSAALLRAAISSYRKSCRWFLFKEFVMPGNFCRRILFALLALAAAGCQQNPLATTQPPPPSPYAQQQQVAMLQQQQSLQSRTSALDMDNQDLQTKLA